MGSEMCIRDSQDYTKKHRQLFKKGENIRKKLKELEIDIPTDYSFASRGELMVGRYLFSKGKVFPVGRSWCEGEAFSFVRQINGREIIDDKCKVIIKGKSVVSFKIVKHNVSRVGTMKIKRLHINEEKFVENKINLKPENIHTKLVYKIEGNRVLPLWQAEYENIVIFFDAMEGTYYEYK